MPRMNKTCTMHKMYKMYKMSKIYKNTLNI